MNISITGTADKRPIVYPLLYALGFTGNTLLLTNDTAYRRLLPNGVPTGEIGNIHIDTTTRTAVEIEDYYRILKADFENIVIAPFEETAVTENIISVVTDTENPKTDFYIRVGYSAVKEKEPYIQLNDAINRYLYHSEISSRILPCKNAQLTKVLANVFAPMFKLNVKEMKRLLLYKGGKVT